jgi:hypothetical protein
MKKPLFLAMSLMLTASAALHASIVYTDCADNTVTYTNSVSVNLNNDATAEFTLSDNGSGSPDPVTAGTMFDNTQLNFVTWAMDADWDAFKNLSYGTMINASAGFYTQGDCYFNPFWATHTFPSGSDQYLGVEFKIGTAWHYGWVRVNLAANGQLTVKDYAYENVAGTAIAAGATSTTGMSETSNDISWTVFPSLCKDEVHISFNDLQSVSTRVFDANGSLVMAAKLENASVYTLNISSLVPGLYFVEILDMSGIRCVRKIVVQ